MKAHSPSSAMAQKARIDNNMRPPHPTATSIWTSVSVCDPSEATKILDVWLHTTEAAYHTPTKMAVSSVPPGGAVTAETGGGGVPLARSSGDGISRESCGALFCCAVLKVVVGDAARRLVSGVKPCVHEAKRRRRRRTANLAMIEIVAVEARARRE